MKYAAIAWAVFLGGLLALGVCDYVARWYGGWLGNGGSPTPDAVWVGVPLLLGVVAVAFLWRATANIPQWRFRGAIVAIQGIIGFLLYVAASLWYVVGTGVDSL